MELQDSKNTCESDNENNNKRINEIKEIQSQSESSKILIDETASKIDNINLKENDKKNNNNIIIENLISKEESEVNEKLSLINIDIEKEKNNEINKKEKEKNKNRIYIENDKDIEDDEEEEELEYMKEDNYLFKFNKEYTNNDNDLHSKRITVKDNNEVYLMTQDENIDNNENVINVENKNDEDEINEKEEEEEEEEDEKDLFPFQIVGDGKKKGSIFGIYKKNKRNKKYKNNKKTKTGQRI